MSTVPSVPVAIAEAKGIAAKVSAYVKHHEIFLLIIIGVVLLWGVTGKIIDYKRVHDQHAYDAQVLELKATVDKNAAQAAANAETAANNAKLAQQYQQIAAQTQAQNAALEASTKQLLAALAQQKSVDKTLPPPALATRIETLAQVPTGSVTPAPGSTFSVTQPGAVGIAQALEEVPVLQQQVKNVTTEKANVEGQLTAQTGVVNGLNTQVTGLNQQVGGLNLQIKQADGVCEAKIKVVKDNAAKSKRKWFIGGVVLGAIARGALHAFAGI